MIQKGQIFQQDKQFHLNFEQQSVTSNGEDVWIHLKNNNEVQIHKASTLEEEDSFMSPQNLLKLYESDAFIFAISDEIKQDGKIVALIECKPIDADSEFSKLRMTVDTRNLNMVSVKAFRRMVLDIHSSIINLVLTLVSLLESLILTQMHFQIFM